MIYIYNIIYIYTYVYIDTSWFTTLVFSFCWRISVGAWTPVTDVRLLSVAILYCKLLCFAMPGQEQRLRRCTSATSNKKIQEVLAVHATNAAVNESHRKESCHDGALEFEFWQPHYEATIGYLCYLPNWIQMVSERNCSELSTILASTTESGSLRHQQGTI